MRRAKQEWHSQLPWLHKHCPFSQRPLPLHVPLSPGHEASATTWKICCTSGDSKVDGLYWVWVACSVSLTVLLLSVLTNVLITSSTDTLSDRWISKAQARWSWLTSPRENLWTSSLSYKSVSNSPSTNFWRKTNFIWSWQNLTDETSWSRQ
jgi:hypothetical protein